MNEPDALRHSPEEERVRERIRSLEPARADERFEARLMREFVAGDIATPAPGPEAEETAPGFRWSSLALAAGLLVVVAFVVNRGAGWVVRPATGQGTITVDGTPYLASAAAQALGSAKAATRIETDPQARFELRVPGFMIVEVMPSSAVTMPSVPGRWFGRTVECRVENGEARFMTGPEFRGARFTVMTPEGRAEVTGTSVAVNRDETGTCICVMHGTARIGTGPDDMEEIPSGMRKVMPSDGSAAFVTEVKAMHRDNILDFERRHPEMHPADPAP